jgi:hypothetical protein
MQYKRNKDNLVGMNGICFNEVGSYINNKTIMFKHKQTNHIFLDSILPTIKKQKKLHLGTHELLKANKIESIKKTLSKILKIIYIIMNSITAGIPKEGFYLSKKQVSLMLLYISFLYIFNQNTYSQDSMESTTTILELYEHLALNLDALNAIRFKLELARFSCSNGQLDPTYCSNLTIYLEKINDLVKSYQAEIDSLNLDPSLKLQEDRCFLK